MFLLRFSPNDNGRRISDVHQQNVRNNVHTHPRLFPRMAVLRRGRQEFDGPHPLRESDQSTPPRIVVRLQNIVRTECLLRDETDPKMDGVGGDAPPRKIPL